MPHRRRLALERWLVPFAGALLCALACAPPLHNPRLDLDYVLRFSPEEGIRVELTASGFRTDRPELQLLAGLGVIQDQASHVTVLEAVDAGGAPLAVERTDEPTRTLWRLRTGGKEPVRVSWRVDSFDPYISPEATFVEPDRAVLLGYSVFLAPFEMADYLPADITVAVEGPEGWPVWTSWGDGAPEFRPETLHDLWSAGVAAGGFQEARLGTGPVEVTVLTDGAWTGTTGLAVANRLLPVLRQMVEVFGAPPRYETLDVLAIYRTYPPDRYRSRMVGVSEDGAFFGLATQDRFQDLNQVTALASHECLHFYFGGAIVAEPEPPYNNAPDLVWLIEGVTEYLAFRMMREADVLSAAEFEEVAEKKRRKMEAVDRRAAVSLATAARLLHEPEIYELVYTRGFHFARYLDETMSRECGEGAFDAALRTLFTTHDFYRDHEWIRPGDVEAVFEAACPGTAERIRRYAHGVEPPPDP